jgi:glucosylceramidase
MVVAPSRSMLLATGFVNPDGHVAVVVMNPTERRGQYHLRVGAAAVTVQTRPHSIQTVVF